MNADKWLWPTFGSKVGQSVQIGMKLELDVWHHPLDVYAKFQTDISQHVQKKSGKLVHQRAKNCPSMTKVNRGQDTHYLSVCIKSEASI